MKIESIKKEVRNIFSKAKGSHDWEHTERVLSLCLHIGKKEKADLSILELAALLHDIGRIDQDKSKGKICHAEAGAKKAKMILLKHKIDPDTIEKIIHCVETHRYRKNKPRETLEADILFDSDKLDSIGAVGIVRAVMFANEVGAKVHNHKIDITATHSYTKEDTAYREFMVKLRFVKDKLKTAEAKRLAKGRHKFMKKFFDRLHNEVTGKW